MERVVILTGGNLGDVDTTLLRAREKLTEDIGNEVAASWVMESCAWGFEAQERFLNQVLVLDTELEPQEVLRRCGAIEQHLGRKRAEGSRADCNQSERCAQSASFSQNAESTQSAARTQSAQYAQSALNTQSAKSPHSDQSVQRTQCAQSTQSPPSARQYSSRTIDIDILFYGQEIIDTPNLTIPHPLIGVRKFVLDPLCQVMPDFVHPVSGLKISEMAQAFCDNQHE